MPRYCGIDFGTSNSVVTILSDAGEEVIREPSLIYFPEHAETTVERHCGAAAVQHWVGDSMRGRFFQSVKTILPDKGFTHTTINGKKFSASDLVAVMLRFLRQAAEERAGEPIQRAVFGRPARFGANDEEDRVAHDRLREAIEQAGFTDARFELEPVAGAHAYADKAVGLQAGREETVLVADHGGGTSDFTLFVLGLGDDGLPESRRILATHGIRAGGDGFDSAIMWNRIVDYFGHGSHYESFGKYLPVPVHIYHIISRWDQIHFLKTLKYREELHYFLRTSDNPLALRRLIKLVEEDLGYFLFQAIEAAKISLSDASEARVLYERGKLLVDEAVSRGQFDSYIDPDLERIAKAVDTTLGRADPAVDPEDVSTVFLTGGSSRIPAIHRIMAERLPAARLVDDADQFQSVSRGLALAARKRGFAASGDNRE